MRLPDGTSYTSGHLRRPNGDTQLRFDAAANPDLDRALGPIGDVDVTIAGTTITVDGVAHVVVPAAVEQLVAALDADPPLQEEVLRLVAEVTAGAVTASTPDYAARRATLQAGLEQLRGLAVIARAQLAALPAPASRTAAEKERAFLRRYLLALTRVVLIAVLRPTADDLTVVQD